MVDAKLDDYLEDDPIRTGCAVDSSVAAAPIGIYLHYESPHDLPYINWQLPRTAVLRHLGDQG
jgi:hypothetical protein